MSEGGGGDSRDHERRSKKSNPIADGQNFAEVSRNGSCDGEDSKDNTKSNEHVELVGR